MTAAEQLVAAVTALPRPAAVGIGGFGGAGKSTLAAALARAVPTAVVVAGDDFLDPAGVRAVTDDWAGLDRARLRRQLLDPLRAGRPLAWQRHDWVSGALAEWHSAPADLLVVEGVGVLHPELRWDLSVWVECPAAVAQARGMARDRRGGSDHDEAWREVWTPTDVAYARRFNLAATADLVLHCSP